MQVVKVSATQLDSYLSYQSGMIDEHALIERLTGEFKANTRMTLGSIFHELLESDSGLHPIFDAEQIDRARKIVGNGVNEYKLRTMVKSMYGDIVLTSKADKVIGNKVVEIKTTYGSFSFDRYCDSVQWKLYSMMFEVPSVEYVVFEFGSVPTIADSWFQCDLNSLTLDEMTKMKLPYKYKDIHIFECHANKHTQSEVMEAVNGLHGFIIKMGISEQMSFEPSENEFSIF